MLLDPLDKIVQNLPYGAGFKFVDKLLEISDDRVVGIYRFRESEPFFQHHFINNPVVPGVILTECMAQIGLACLGSYLIKDEVIKSFAMTENHVVFLKQVQPETTVIVSAVKKYHRFGKLKVLVQMLDENENKVAEGWMSGMSGS